MSKKIVVLSSVFIALGVLGFFLANAVFNARVAARRTQDK